MLQNKQYLVAVASDLITNIAFRNYAEGMISLLILDKNRIRCPNAA